MCDCNKIPKNFNCPTVQKLWQWMQGKQVQWFFVRSSEKNFEECFPYEQRRDMINHRVQDEITQLVPDSEIVPEWQRGFIYLFVDNTVNRLEPFNTTTQEKDLRYRDSIIDTDSTPYLQFRFGTDEDIEMFLMGKADFYYYNSRYDF